MRTGIALAALALSQLSYADILAVPSVCAAPTGTWQFEEILNSFVEPGERQRGHVANDGQPQVILHQCFSDRGKCEQARTTLNAFGFTVPLGTGGGAQSHIGRTVSDCFER